MKAKLLTGLILFSLMGACPLLAAELQPYQKEALEKLEAFHGKHWPAVRQQYESVIQQASEEQAQAMVKMITEARKKDSNNPDERETAKAARKDIEKQIAKPYDAFIEHVSQLGAERHKISQEASREIYGSEKGGRLHGVAEALRSNKFISSKSIDNGFEELRLAREELMEKKTYHKITFSTGSPPDNTIDVRAIVAEAIGKIKSLNQKYGNIAFGIKKRIDAIPYSVDVQKTLKDLQAEQERHNKLLSAEVITVVNDMNAKIAEHDLVLFNWIIQPLRDAQPHSEPVAQR
jgi:uncharacterized protein (UPF0335 family)